MAESLTTENEIPVHHLAKLREAINVGDPQKGSQHIQALREHLRLTPTEFAVRLGVAPITVKRWEAGEYNPRVSHLRAIEEKFFGRPVIDQVGLTGHRLELTIFVENAEDAIDLLAFIKQQIKSHPSNPNIARIEVQ